MTSPNEIKDKPNFRVGGWLYFCGNENADLEKWWKVVEIKQKYYPGDIVNNVPAGTYYDIGIEWAGTLYWYAEYIIQPIGKNIKYVDTPEEKLFLQLAEKNL